MQRSEAIGERTGRLGPVTVSVIFLALATFVPLVKRVSSRFATGQSDSLAWLRQLQVPSDVNRGG
jgi:hypothetical protein